MELFGVVKVATAPPEQLELPLLLENTDGRLLFHLNEIKDGTFASIELKKALEFGYIVTRYRLATRIKRIRA